MAKNEKTAPDIASLASKALRKPGSITKKQIKSLAGAALTQAADAITALVTPAPKPAAAKKAAATPVAATKPKPAKSKSAAKPKAAPKPNTAAKPKAATKAKVASKPAKASSSKPKRS